MKDTEIFSGSDPEVTFTRRKLEENALALAKKPSVTGEGEEIESFIAFTSCGVKFLIEAGKIIEVVRFREVVPLPGMEKKLVGIYNFRGTVTGVFSVDVLVNEADQPSSDPHYILICSNGGVIFALACDEIEGIENRALAGLRKDEGSGILKNIFSGVFPDSARLLDMDRLTGDGILKIS